MGHCSEVLLSVGGMNNKCWLKHENILARLLCFSAFNIAIYFLVLGKEKYEVQKTYTDNQKETAEMSGTNNEDRGREEFNTHEEREARERLSNQKILNE